MKGISFSSIVLSILSIVSCNVKSPGEYVDPNIGGVAPLLTTVAPQVHRPHSMVRVFPLTEPGLNDRYLSDRIYGIIFNMPKYRFGYTTSILPTSGELKLQENMLSSWYDHDNETLHPWHHKIWLEDFRVSAEWTTTEHTVYYRFKYYEDEKFNIIIRMKDFGEINVKDGNVIYGWESIDYAKQYFYAVLDTECDKYGTITGNIAIDSCHMAGKGIGTWLSKMDWKGTIGVRVGISYISVEQARRNLENENLGNSFDEIKNESKKIWESTLGKIKVSGGEEKQKRIFYTSLYRTAERMVCQSEGDRYYSGFDRKIHTDTIPFYNDDWAWDTYRNLHALGFIMDPVRKAHELQSFARMYKQWGWVPQFPELTEWGGDWFTDASKDWQGEPMIGNHVASITAEAIRKGIIDFDIKTLYEGLKKNSLEGTMIPWRAGKAKEPDIFYNQHGYFPALAPGEKEPYSYIDDGWEKRQAVSVTLEHSYNDWCIAQIAEYLGYNEDYKLFMKRSLNYLNLWNPSTGYFAPKNIKGEWIEPFDPELCDGYGARSYFAEVNACVHAFHVQHDIPKLIELMGGNEKFIERIDQAYNKPTKIDKWRFMGLMPDATGLQGLIPVGNEPSFHIPWLYNYAGAPWKTQYRVRQIADVWFGDGPTGLSGDEDGGALCAWYVFAALGFYPVNPPSGEYSLSSPIFEKVEIQLPDEKKFVIIADNASKSNKYIKSVSLNGEKLDKPFISHNQIIKGGILRFELTDRPCYDCFSGL